MFLVLVLFGCVWSLFVADLLHDYLVFCDFYAMTVYQVN